MKKGLSKKNPGTSSDPSGYIYEGTADNRLSGVDVSIYYRDEISGEVILWDAESFGQINHQITEENGEFGWDVPRGLWQIRCQKEGYEDYIGEWMSVPPVRENIAIEMYPADAQEKPQSEAEQP